MSKTVEITRADSTIETVTVNLLPVRKFHEYLVAQDDEPAMIALATGKDAAYIDALPIAEHEKLVAGVVEVNDEPFQNWILRRRARLSKVIAAGKATAPGSPT